MADFLPYGRQTIEDDDIAAVTEALRSDYLTTGPKVDEFETAFAEAVGVEHAVACNSGTAALHLALLALDVGPGHVCIAPSTTFLATANAARFCGADVVFTDVDPATGLMTAATLTDALGRADGKGELKAVLPVHMAGRLVDMKTVGPIAAGAGAAVVADSCHALGSISETDETPAQQADMACYSFHPVKTLTTAEGGMVTAQDTRTAARLKLFRSHGMVRSPNDPAHYDMVELGFNYRIPDVLCALGLNQLGKLHRFVHRRQELAAAYDAKLAGLSPHLSLCPSGTGQPALHLYTVLIDFEALGKERHAVMEHLAARGIGTQVHYIPVHRQPYYAGLYGEQSLPGAEAWHAKTLSLPLYPGMADSDVDRVAEALAEALG